MTDQDYQKLGEKNFTDEERMDFLSGRFIEVTWGQIGDGNHGYTLRDPFGGSFKGTVGDRDFRKAVDTAIRCMKIERGY